MDHKIIWYLNQFFSIFEIFSGTIHNILGCALKGLSKESITTLPKSDSRFFPGLIYIYNSKMTVKL